MGEVVIWGPMVSAISTYPLFGKVANLTANGPSSGKFLRRLVGQWFESLFGSCEAQWVLSKIRSVLGDAQ